MGYCGSDKTVRRYLQPLRGARNPRPSGPAAPSVRQATGWLTRHPDRLTDDERTELEALLERSPALATTRDLVHDFAEIMIERCGSDLGAWMAAVDTRPTTGSRKVRQINIHPGHACGRENGGTRSTSLMLRMRTGSFALQPVGSVQNWVRVISRWTLSSWSDDVGPVLDWNANADELNRPSQSRVVIW